MNYGGINDIPSIINIPHGIRNYNISYSFLCYTNKTSFHDPITSEEQTILKLQETIQALGQIFFQGQTTQQKFLYSYIKRDNMLMTYPCLQRFDINDYQPENRTWYKDLTKNYESHNPYNTYDYSITEPYIFFNTSNIGLSVVLPIVDSNLMQIGGVSIDFNPTDLFKNIFEDIGSQHTMIFMVSDEGILILHPYNITNDQLPLYIYNESITGFSHISWQLLKSMEGNCTGFSDLMMFHCLHNSITDEMYLVSIKQIPNCKISLIVLVSDKEFNTFQKEYNTSLLSKLQLNLQLQILSCFLTYLIIVALVILIIKKICAPLELIIEMLMSEIRKIKSSREMKFFNLTILNREIRGLYQACLKFYQQLNRFSFKKTNQCLILEKFKYPQKGHKMLISTDGIPKDYQDEKQALEIIKKGLK